MSLPGNFVGGYRISYQFRAMLGEEESSVGREWTETILPLVTDPPWHGCEPDARIKLSESPVNYLALTVIVFVKEPHIRRDLRVMLWPPGRRW